jgi:hypothetical protein
VVLVVGTAVWRNLKADDAWRESEWMGLRDDRPVAIVHEPGFCRRSGEDSVVFQKYVDFPRHDCLSVFDEHEVARNPLEFRNDV